MSLLPNLLSKFVKAKNTRVLCKPTDPPLSSSCERSPLPPPQTWQFVERGYLKNYPSRYSNWPHITTKKLPRRPTDIKGVDHIAYTHVERKQMFKKMPMVKQNAFFKLKFFPYYHHLSLVRKSNIAYTFSNGGGSPLNDSELYKAFKAYKGPYARNAYFRTTPHPKDKAVARAKFRKLIKRSLFEALHAIVPNEAPFTVSGIWFFKFDASPRTEDDYAMIKRDMHSAVKKVHKDREFQLKLGQLLQKHNKDFNYGEILVKDATLENNPGANRVPGYYPKLPFIKNTALLL